MKPIRTQSKDPVIQDAARQGVRVYCFCGGYWTATAKEMARQARVSESYIRRTAWIHSAGCGLSADVDAGKLTDKEAYRLARIIVDVRESGPPDAADTDIRRIAELRLIAQDDNSDADSRKSTINQQSEIETLAEAVTEIRRLRAMLQDAGIDPD